MYDGMIDAIGLESVKWVKSQNSPSTFFPNILQK
jgi:hypothetical protein